MAKKHKSLNSKNLNKKSIALKADAAKKLQKLKELLKKYESTCWQIGDLCIDLIDNYGLSLREIGDAVGYTKARISHFHLTARAFPVEKRKGYTFQDSLTARQIHVRMPRLDMSLYKIRDEISKLDNKTARAVRSHFVNYLMNKEINSTNSNTAAIAAHGIINNVYNEDWRNVINKLPDNSIKMVIADPPFGFYQKEGDGRYISYRNQTSGLRYDCDFQTSQDALSVTLPLFKSCKSKMAKDGVLLLFQPGGKPDNIQVLNEAYEHNWECVSSLTWQKSKYSAGSATNPYHVCTEKILVFIKNEDVFKKHQIGTPTSDVLYYPNKLQGMTSKMDAGKVDYYDYHIFQKPEELMELLIKYHSYPNDLIFEPFGCSGSACISAINTNRNWVYVESNTNNFNWGKKRIAQKLKEYKSETG